MSRHPSHRGWNLAVRKSQGYAGAFDNVGGEGMIQCSPATRGTSPVRPERIAPGERHPSVHGSRRGCPSGTAKPADERRRPYRSPHEGARTPAPTSGQPYPATVVKRSVSPWRIVDPGPAPGTDPRPATEAVRRPADRNRRREPDIAVGRVAFPCPVAVEIGCADHLAGNVTRRCRAVVAPIAHRAPGVEAIAAEACLERYIGRVRRADRSHLSR